jgi:hypothetical protein
MVTVSKGKYMYTNSCPFVPVPDHIILLNNTLTYFQIAAYITIIAVYPPYPFSRNIKSYFIRRGYEAAVVEYELVKKILYAVIPLFIITTSLTVIHDLDYHYKYVKAISPCGKSWINRVGEPIQLPEQFHPLSSFVDPHKDTFYYIQYLLMLIVVGAVLKIAFVIFRSGFRLYFAKGCFILLEKKKDEVEKMRYFVMGLNSYNLYLRQQIKLEIVDRKKIYSKIASSAPAIKNDAIDKISLVFQEDKFEYEEYTLEPLRYLCKFQRVPETEILIEQPLKNKLKDYGAAAAVLIPLAVQILNVIHI